MEPLKDYTVHVTFAHPAWDEKDGLDIDVTARTKRDACKSARRKMSDAGHLGRMSFKATETAGMFPEKES